MDTERQDQGTIEPRSPPWSDTTKRMVVAGTVVLMALILHRFSQLLPPLAVVMIVVYVLNPVVRAVTTYTRLPRTAAVALLYLILIIPLGLLPALLAPDLIKQVRAIDLNLQQIAEDFDHFLSQPMVLGGYSLELKPVWHQVREALQDLLSPVASRTVSVLFNAVTSLAWLIFILVISFYLLKDQPAIMRYLYHLVPPPYRLDARILSAEINSIWNAFFRGQLVLSLVVGSVVGITMAIVGLRNAGILGVLAGALEILPNIGPVLAAVPAVLIALFQGSTYLPLPPFWFALLVAGLYWLIQQVENHYLVPRIIGRSLNLHPLVVIIGVVAGADLAGVVGALLAAPILATLRILGSYARRKLLDQPPFPWLMDQAVEAEEGGNGEASVEAVVAVGAQHKKSPPDG